MKVFKELINWDIFFNYIPQFFSEVFAVMNRIKLLAVSVCFIFLGTIGCDTGGGSSEEMKEILDTQKAMLKELKEIKQALGPQQARRPAQQAPQNVVLSVDKFKIKGDEDAPVTLIEFSDYQCPFCGRFASNTLPQIVEEYIDTGKVKLAFVDYPLGFHKFAPKASEAAHCAGEQEKYWEMHDVLFENVKALQPENLPKYAEEAGVTDIESFNACLDSGKYEELVNGGVAMAKKAGVRGTPGFHLGYSTEDDKNIKSVKFIRGAVPFATFKADIDGLLSEQEAANKK